MNLLPETLLASMKLLRLKAGKPKNLSVTSLNNFLYLPLYENFSELNSGFSGLFGSEASRKLFPRIFFSKKITYQNPFVSSPKEITNSTIQSVDSKFKDQMNFDSNPISILVGNKNVFVDTTEIIPNLIPKNFSDMKSIYSKAITFYPEILHWFLFGFSKKELDLAHFTKNLSWTGTPLSSASHEVILVPIPIDVKDKRIANTFMNPDTKVSDFVLRDPKAAKAISMTRMICQIVSLETDSEESKLFASSLEKEKRLVFFFHNDEMGFFVSLNEIRSKKMKYENFFSIFKQRLLSLMASVGDEDAAKPEDFEEDKETIDALAQLKTDPVSDDKKEVISTITNLKNRKVAQRSQDLLADLKHAVVEKPLDSVSLRKKGKVVGSKDSDELKILADANLEEDLPDEIPDDVPEEAVKAPAKDALPTAEEEPEGSVETETNLDDLLKEVERERRPAKTPAQIRRIMLARETYKSIKLGEKTVEEILASPVLDIDTVPSKAQTRDESVRFFTTVDMDRSYVSKTMEYDILKIMRSFSDGKSINLHLIKIDKDDTSDQFNEKTTYKFTFEDENQKRHTVKVDFPKVDKNGFLKINGNVKILKKQLIPIPILKIKPDAVSVSSNFNKVLVERQGSIINRNSVVLKRLLGEIDDKVKGISTFYGNNSDSNSKYVTNLEYDELAKTYHRLVVQKSVVDKIIFYFNQKEIRELISGLKLKLNVGELPIGINYRTRTLITVDLRKDESVSDIITRTIVESGLFPGSLAIIEATSVPKKRAYTRLMIQSRTVPLIIFLGSLFGLKKILEVRKIPVDFVEKRIQGDKRPVIRFTDGYLYYPEYPIADSLLLNGLASLETESMSIEDLETPLPYIEYCYDSFKTRNVIKGWVGFQELFLDPITVEVLANYSLPTDFLEVFLYANDLLDTNTKDSEIMRVRGFETLNAMLYESLARSYLEFKQKINPKNQTFSIPQTAILDKLHKSFIMENYDTINPVNEMKMRNVVTYKGPQGINTAEAFTLDKRAYDPSMVGIIGISSVDSDQVGIVKHLTINPRIKSTRGYFDSLGNLSEASTLSLGNLATAEEAMIPFLNRHDDPKRQGFASNQTKHVISVKGSEIPFVLTGVEQALPYKIGDTFAYKTKQDGTIVSLNEEHKYLVVEYKNGEKERVDYGQQLNRNSSFFLMNNLKVDVSVGQKVRQNDILVYNEEFIRKRNGRFFIVQGTMARVAIIDEDSTEEDSSDISEVLARKMTTDFVNRKQIGLGRLANILSWKEVGEKIHSGEVFMVFENATGDDETTATLLDHIGPIDEETLSELTRHKPISKYTGVITDMKVYWSVPLDQMSPSSRKFVKKYIDRLQKEIDEEEKATGKSSEKRRYLGISEPIRDRINGVEISQDGGIVIEYFVTKENGMDVGHKLSYHSSLKSIVAHVWPKELMPYTETGNRVDATMGFIAIEARMTSSPIMAGWMMKTLDEVGRNIANEYLGTEKK